MLCCPLGKQTLGSARAPRPALTAVLCRCITLLLYSTLLRMYLYLYLCWATGCDGSRTMRMQCSDDADHFSRAPRRAVPPIARRVRVRFASHRIASPLVSSRRVPHLRVPSHSIPFNNSIAIASPRLASPHLLFASSRVLLMSPPLFCSLTLEYSEYWLHSAVCRTLRSLFAHSCTLQWYSTSIVQCTFCRAH